MGTLRALIGGAGALAVAAVVALGTAAAAPSTGGHDHGSHGSDRLPGPAFAELKSGTRPFRDVEVAVDAGFVDLGLCFDQMGEHFANPAAPIDGQLDPLAPETLVYAHDGDDLELVAIEWVSTVPGSVHGFELHFSEAVQLWVMHAWIWELNPDGQLADFNPRLGDCPT